MKHQWLFFSELKHTKLRASDNNKVGVVDDAVLDLQTGALALYITGSGGFLGLGTEKVALPASALRFAEGESRLNVNEEALQTAPGTENAWPERIDSTFINSVHRHFGYRDFTES